MPSLIPVDHDPFMGAASAAPILVSADHDPFAGTAAVGPRFVPVDHDPFSNTPAATPKLIPVDFDPFNDTAVAALNLGPVDYDPFVTPASAASNPQINVPGPGIANFPTAPFPGQRVPANQLADATLPVHGLSGGVLYHNHPDGTCGYCDTHLRTLLPEKAWLRVVPPEDAVPKNSKARSEPTEYEGNSAAPKAPQTKGILPPGADNENEN